MNLLLIISFLIGLIALIFSKYYLDNNILTSGIKTGIISIISFMIFCLIKILIVINPLVEAMK